MKCVDCGITSEEAKRTDHGATFTRGAYRMESWETSFTSNNDGTEARCAPCRKEHGLKTLFDMMDKRERRLT